MPKQSISGTESLNSIKKFHYISSSANVCQASSSSSGYVGRSRLAREGSGEVIIEYNDGVDWDFFKPNPTSSSLRGHIKADPMGPGVIGIGQDEPPPGPP